MAISGNCESLSAALPEDLLFNILYFLPPNDIAISARLVCRAARRQFRNAPVSLLAGPLPARVAEWPLSDTAHEAFKAASCNQRHKLLGGVVAIGLETDCDVNAEMLWRFMAPGWRAKGKRRMSSELP